MNWDIFVLLAYRLAVLLCGYGAIAMGYRLFRLGVFEKAGELKANWGGRSLLLKAAAPGTFFALFGSAIIAITIWKGFAVETTKPSGSLQMDAHSLSALRAGSPEVDDALRTAIDGRPLSDEQKRVLASALGLVEKRSVQAK